MILEVDFMESEKIRGEAKSLTYRGIELTYCELGESNSDVIYYIN